MYLSENEWLLLNQIIYNIHSTRGDFDLRSKMLKDVKFLMTKPVFTWQTTAETPLM
ncbi:hypothetical protein RX717_08735 [Intestinibacillus sp. NTUH-41-i26]|uniref:hypothetical protein n=1 Tax=Butyricicoccaceae TaxID=3085642 RepID=UPI00131CDD73|nr:MULTISPECIES: hypothetical protein [Butyricicoccaceae]WOC74113.1 hypothetical protein RX717_08735 [Intestinibacillus sp. NTUH-41-i26]